VPAAQLQREVKQLVDEWLPTLETNAAQTDVEVLELLLRQLGYPSNPSEEVRGAWLGGVRMWRDKKAQDERHVAALRAYLEMGAMASNLDDLPPELHEPSALMNATLAQFEVPIDMAMPTVKAELLQELDMDGDDVSERAQPILEAGLAVHMEWRRAVSQAKLATTLDQLLALVRPVGRVASNKIQPSGSDRLAVERLVAKALTQIPGKLTSNAQAFGDLLWALNLTATAPAAAADGEGSAVSEIPAEPALAPGVELAPGVLRLLRDATVTHCEGLRRQARREASIKRLQKLLVADVGADDPLALGESDTEGAHEGANDVEEGEGGVAQAERAASALVSASAATAPPTTWDEHGAALVADVYGGYEEQVREMQPLELLLDVLRMAQLQEDEIRKGERAALEAAIAGFLRDNAAAAERPLPLDPPTTKAAAAAAAAAASTRGVHASTEAQLAAAGWQASGLGAMATDKVSTILRRGGGDGSDFSLVIAALVHSLGGKVRLSVVCVPPNAVAAAAAAASSSAAAATPEPPITYLQRRCRLVTEARVGLHPNRVVSWVAARHESGAGAVGVPAPRVHFRREVDGATWLSLGWRPGEAYPGGAYLEPVDRLDEAEWTTFYPFDEHGCKWHLRGTEADSSRKPHSSPPVQSLLAGEGGAEEEDQRSRMGEDFF